MVKHMDSIGPDQRAWIEKQKLFFVASAALDPNGTVNTSPKGYDSFRVLGPNQVCYLEISGSGIETQSHVQENGRLTVMFIAFEGAPKTMRLRGRGRVCSLGSPEFLSLYDAHFKGSADLDIDKTSGLRSIIVMDVNMVSISCGFSVPLYEYKGNRPTLMNYWSKRSDDQVTDFWIKENAQSLDGLPGMRHERMGPKYASTPGSNWWNRCTEQQLLSFGAALTASFSAGVAVSFMLLKRYA
ncbi:hypothetical protein B0O80DRAFT_435546 [Mortierella sp. GBAus27b]|nr:hypothetical protein BGX31_007439 [Mortierella sp. GBA43]KAI8362314.1 hypothetical protein B0O80DRAFT_435546 [Mortierella sp. GBAus27b]